MTKREIIKLRSVQHCFVSGGYMFCNFIIRGGKVIYSKKGYMRFPVRSRKDKRKTKIEINEIVEKVKKNGLLQKIVRSSN